MMRAYRRLPSLTLAEDGKPIYVIGIFSFPRASATDISGNGTNISSSMAKLVAIEGPKDGPVLVVPDEWQLASFGVVRLDGKETCVNGMTIYPFI
jgi:hypothetical protein